MTLSRILLRSFLAVLLLAPGAAAGPYESMASELVTAAKKQGKRRVAVLTFSSLGNRTSSDGLFVSEKFIGPIASLDVEVVERTLLESVMREQQLGVYGVADARSVKELGRILGVDALVTGTIMRLKDDRLEINARLIDAETAKVLAVSRARVEKDWEEPFSEGFDTWTLPMPPAPILSMAAPAAAAEWRPGRQTCGQSAERIDEIERAALPMKVRRWVRLLSDPGFSLSSLSRNPGSEIRNPEVRAQFYAGLRAARGARPRALDVREEARLDELEQQVRAVSEACL